jgi:DNA mismatch repair protein MutS
LPLFAAVTDAEPAADPLTSALEAIDPDSMSPREALEALYALKRLAAAGEAI